jgi:diguanylate cyclase (GGDEF)-like protein/putative nucleotidyltransferase with HDIG domain
LSVTTRSDLLAGSAHGLALSAVVWTTVVAPPRTSAGLLELALLVLVAGIALAGRPRIVVYPSVLAALLLHGPAASLIAALVAFLASCLAAAAPRRRVLLGRGFLLGRMVGAAAVGAGTFALLGGTWGLGSAASPAGLCGHAAAFALTDLLGARVGRVSMGRRLRPGSAARSLLGSVPRHAVGVAVGAIFALAFGRPAWRPLAVAGVVLALLGALLVARRRHRGLIREHSARVAEICSSVARALAMAVEARDEPTQRHLRRVERLCGDVGRRLGLSPSELEALSAAALLHDIGKVAVPDGILRKPGRLSLAEMERVKAHATVGADILEVIPFPHAVASIVRHHHERWDGEGYPAGLASESIPLASRILAAVDSYDALTSDRPYRQALSHEEAVGFLRREEGRMFDPLVVEALLTRLAELPRSAVAGAAGRAEVDDSGAEDGSRAGQLPLAQRELQTLYDVARATGYGLDLEEYLTLVACKLAALVPHRSLVVYSLAPDDAVLRARFAMGQAADRLRLMTIGLGERLSGWAALQRRSVIGQPHLAPVERDGSRSDLEEWTDDEEVRGLRSTLAAPMVAGERTLGVLTLYDGADRRYTADDRRILIRVAGYVAQVLGRLESRETSIPVSLTDPLTGLPSARFLWLESAHRVAHARSSEERFGLIAFRVNGLERVSERLGNETADRLLGQIARRFAASCHENESLVRFGQDLFIVLTSSHRPGHLVERWHELRAEIEQPAVEARSGTVHQVRLTVAHASFPEDGEDMEALLRTLDTRLTLAAEQGQTVVPFRAKRLEAASRPAPA